jgi:predicted RND superfamily exporter protein
VIHVNTITDTLKRLNKNLHEDADEWYRVPQQRDLAAQYLLLYEMSLPYGLDLNDQINIDKSATRFIVTTESLSTKDTLEMVERAREWIRANGLNRSGDVKGSSPNIMFAHITGRNIKSMLVGTTAALVLISLILIVALRSLKLGLISMVPNLVPAALAFGLWGIVVGQIGLAISVVSAMSLGIIVDDTVHFLTKYERARREQGMDAQDAVRYAFSTVGMALWVTSLVLVAGFLVLSQSAFQVNSGMGLLTAIVIMFALIADFLFLPPLLIRLSANHGGKC